MTPSPAQNDDNNHQTHKNRAGCHLHLRLLEQAPSVGRRGPPVRYNPNHKRDSPRSRLTSADSGAISRSAVWRREGCYPRGFQHTQGEDNYPFFAFHNQCINGDANKLSPGPFHPPNSVAAINMNECSPNGDPRSNRDTPRSAKTATNIISKV